MYKLPYKLKKKTIVHFFLDDYVFSINFLQNRFKNFFIMSYDLSWIIKKKKHQSIKPYGSL